ncbi:MAG: hypothetical protein AAGI08_18445 [Bacteroidota bacterium]
MKSWVTKKFAAASERFVRLTPELRNEVVAQKTLMQQYRMSAATDRALLPSFADAGFRKYSQFDEDGILLYLFSLIDPINRVCVEICAGDGRQCNAANLIINHGWWGHLFDGNPNYVAAGERFYKQCRDTFLHPPQFTKAWVSAENVNELIAQSGAEGPIGMLSLDIDGMDYWVWKAIDVVEPQVVVCETHNPIPADRSLTVPYDPQFVFEKDYYRGASLAAMVKLGKEKGYRLVGTHQYGFNAFFIKDGVGEEFFPEVSANACLNDPFTQKSQQERWPKAKNMNWQEV